MNKSRVKQAAVISSIVIFITLIIIGQIIGVPHYLGENILVIILTLFLYFTYKKWNLSLPIFIFILLSFIPHNLGVFGFYYQSPVFIPWDHITHFIIILSASLLFFKFMEPFLDSKFLTLNNIFLLFIIISSALGVGTFIENAEFLGFFVNGVGEGGFAVGSGDGLPGQMITSIEDMEEHGVGWINTMWDLIYNFFGALTGVILMSISKYSLRQH